MTAPLRMAVPFLAFAIALVATILSCGAARSHALDPGYLDLRVEGEGAWRVLWRVPGSNGRPLDIEAVLPETCSPREPSALEADGTAFVAVWVALCPAGLEDGTLQIRGLEATLTDVLVRYEHLLFLFQCFF